MNRTDTESRVFELLQGALRQRIARMSDAELERVHRHLESLPAAGSPVLDSPDIFLNLGRAASPPPTF